MADSSARTIEERCSDARWIFWKTAARSAMRFINQAPSRWIGPEAHLYRDEKMRISKHLDPLFWGACTSVFLFLTFRVSGSRWYTDQFLKHARDAAARPSSQATLKSYVELQTEKRNELIKESIRLTSDLIISTFCGLSAAAFLSKPSLLPKDFTESPLIQKRSLVYETFCPDLVNQYKTLDKIVFEKPTDETLQVFHDFVHNCNIRSAFIQNRQASGGSTQTMDVVPYPGLKGIKR